MYIIFIFVHNSIMEQLMRSLVVSKHGEDLHFPISSPPVSPLPLPFCFLAKTKGPAEIISAGFFMLGNKFVTKTRKEYKKTSTEQSRRSIIFPSYNHIVLLYQA
jgi:hypothetical protein